MALISSIIQRILKTNSIVSYLHKNGHDPVKAMTGGRLSYLCPLPGHSESKPSFMVWTNAEYENFYCFGCLRCYSIVHLISFMEDLSYRDVIHRLSDGLVISTRDEIESQLQMMRKLNSVPSPFATPDLLVQISNMCRCYLQSVENDPDEIGIIQKLYSSIDLDLFNYDFDSIENTYQSLPEILQKRMIFWESTRFQKNVGRFKDEST